VQTNTVSFAKDIRVLFRAIDVAHMRPHEVRLDDYAYMSDPANGHKNALDVRDFLSGARQPRMPIGGPYWTVNQLALFERWMLDGFLP
jgi:hypothetical protein